MKKINKSQPPNKLTEFYTKHPLGSWAEFRNNNSGADYKEIKELIFRDQGELCAYCEKSLDGESEHLKQIEHFHSKSDTSTSTNWSLLWGNIIGVCSGGRYDAFSHQLPQNLSCDQYKAHLVSIGRLNASCDGAVLNPLEIIAYPSLFELDMATCELKPSQNIPSSFKPSSNDFRSVNDLILNTINVFNLNCDRLTEDRKVIRNFLSKQATKAKAINDYNYKDKIAKVWFTKKWTDYHTTKRILLGAAAENYLKSINYDG